MKQGERSVVNKNDMQERRTRSQGPPSLSENNELIQWKSLQDPVRIEREQAEARRVARQTSTLTSISENKTESSEILQKETEPHQSTEHMPTRGEISPKEQESESIALQSGEISPKHQKKRDPRPLTPSLGKILQKKTQQVADSAVIGKGIIVNLNGENIEQDSPQVDTAEHYLDNNFSDVMRSLALGSNVSSLFNTTAFNTINTNNEHKVTLDWVINDGRNSHLETLQDKHIMDFPAPRGKTGAMLVY